MKQLRSIAVLSFLLPIILQPSPTEAQSSAVTSLQQRLMAPPGTVTLNVAELRLSKVNHADVRVEGGAIHLRLQNTIAKLDIDEVAHQGDALHVRKVEASFDKKNDTLRITVATDGGSFAPVAFVVGKDALATMDEPALEGLIAPVLGVSGGAQPVAQPAAQPSRPETPLAEIPPPPPPPEETQASGTRTSAMGKPASWLIKADGSGGKDAYIAGTVRSGNQTTPVVLSLSCSVSAPNRDTPRSTDTLQMVLRGRPKALDAAGDCEAPNPLQNLDASVSIGDRPEEYAGTCANLYAETETAIDLPIEPGFRFIRDLLAAPGSSLRIRLNTGDTAAPVVANLQLPKDVTVVAALINPCLDLEAKSSRLAPPHSVLSCPYVEGKGLRHADVLTATGTPLATSPDPDAEGATTNHYVLPKATTAHPTPPKMTLECAYGKGWKKAAESEVLDTRKLVIPVTAKVCDIYGLAELGTLTANCDK